MSKYKTKYFEILDNKKASNRKYIIQDIHEIYNFMCNCGCLEKPWLIINEEGKIMKYNNASELFETNKKFFNDDIKNLCRYTTLTNLENGVGHAIKTFALNK